MSPFALLVLAAAADPWAGAVGPLVKVRPGAVPEGAPSARLLLAKGECEAVQLVTRPPLREVAARLEPLAGPGRPLLPRLYREAFVEVKTPSNGQGAPGLWPDPLIPTVDAYVGERRDALPHDSTPERPLVLYLEVCAPKEQAPGTYRGAVVLTAEDRPSQRVLLAAEVQPFAIPATSSLPSSFGLSLYSVSRGHGVAPESAEARALLRRYATALLAHRLSAHGMSMEPPRARWRDGALEVDFSEYDAELAPFLEGTVLPSGARFTTTDLRDWLKAPNDEARVAYYRAFQEHFRQRGWRARLFFYAKDEPRLEHYPLVLEQAARVRRAGDTPVLVTSALEPALNDAADILCPTLNCFFPRRGPETCPRVSGVPALRRALRRTVSIWWYQSCNAHGCHMGPAKDAEVERVYSGWASYMIDHPATHNRAMGPLAFLAGVDGELYFDTVYAFNLRDPWEGLFDFGGNGDGTLFYPGTPKRIGGRTPVPVESLRLKHIRDGLEDYELLRLAEGRGLGRAAAKAVRQLARSGYDITSDPATWERVRSRLASELRRAP